MADTQPLKRSTALGVFAREIGEGSKRRFLADTYARLTGSVRCHSPIGHITDRWVAPHRAGESGVGVHQEAPLVSFVDLPREDAQRRTLRPDKHMEPTQ